MKSLREQNANLQRSLTAVQQDRDNMSQFTVENVTSLLGGDVVVAKRAKLSEKGNQGVERIVRWLGDSMLKLVQHGTTLTNGRFDSQQLLGFATSRLKVEMQPTPANISLLLRGNTKCAENAKKTGIRKPAGKTGIERIVRWMADSIARISQVGHEMTSGHIQAMTLLEYASYSLKVIPRKMTRQRRTAKELNMFLGLPISQAVRFSTEIKADNPEALKRLVIWISSTIKHIAQIVTIKPAQTSTQTANIPTWRTLLELVTRRLKIQQKTPISQSCSPNTSLDVTSVDTEKLVRAVLSRWQAEMKAGLRKEAERTLSLLVRAIRAPRKNIPRISQHLADSKIKKGSIVVEKAKTWTNAGVSRHARSRATVLEVTDGVAKCQHETRVFAYDLIDGKGNWHFGVDPSKVQATDHSEKTQPGGNSRTPRFKSGTPLKMENTDGNLFLTRVRDYS